MPRIDGQDEEEVSEEVSRLNEIKAEMEQVEIDIIQNGGVNCGWDANDHKDFLRLCTQMPGKTGTVAFFNAMARTVPLADEAAVRGHLEAHKKYTDLTNRKKELLTSYKKAKEDERIARMTKVSKATKAYGKLNNDLDLDLGVGRRESSSAASKRTGDLTTEERLRLKDQLREWKSKKVEEDKKEREDRIAEERQRQARLQRKVQ